MHMCSETARKRDLLCNDEPLRATVRQFCTLWHKGRRYNSSCGRRLSLLASRQSPLCACVQPVG